MDDELRWASSIGGAAQLRDIRQVRTSAELQKLWADGGLHAAIEQTYDWTRTGSVLVCEATCEVEVSAPQTEGEGTDEDDDAVFRASVTFAALYGLPEDYEARDEAFDAFARISAGFSLHPYLREAIQGLTSRAGLPPLVLATMRSPLLSHDETDGESQRG